MCKRFFISLLFLVLSVACVLPATEAKSGYTTYITVQINLPKATFTLGEPLEGEVLLFNSSLATLPATFAVKLFHNDQLHYMTTTSIKTLFPGETKFAFKNFGIPQIIDRPQDVGQWTIKIVQSNQDELEAIQAVFEIVDNTK